MNKNSFLHRSFAAAMAAVMLSTSAYALTDISGHWAQESINKWVDAGIIKGYQDNTFKPNNNITRAEFATILSRVLKDPATQTNHRFNDVPQNAWYFDAVQKLCSLGVVSVDKNFNPHKNITREQVMVMAARAFNITATNKSILNKFKDGNKVSNYAVDAVCGFIEKGYLSGYNDGTIRPQNNITRAECVYLLEPLNFVPNPTPTPNPNPTPNPDQGQNQNSLETIMQSIYAGVKTELPATVNTTITKENVQYYLGLTSMDGIERAIASDAMISSIPHSVCLVEVKKGTDIVKMMKEIKENVDPNKWICVGVEPYNVVVKAQGNYILLVMDNTAANEIANSFISLKLGAEIKLPETTKPEQKPEQKPETTKPPQPTFQQDGLLKYNDYYMDYLGDLRKDYVTNFAQKINSIKDTYLKDATNVYYTVVPSKQYFVNDKLEKPFDYQSMFSILRSNIKDIKEIDLTKAMHLESYLKTDPHWKQEDLQSVVNALGKEMGFEIDLARFTRNTVENFTGQHGYNKSGFPSEKLTYLTNTAIDNAVVDNYQDKDFTKIYNLPKLQSNAPYDMFLSGPTPLITIKNTNANTDKELVMFRDSFASSLAPLLVEHYKSITLVDIRYMASSILPQFVDFSGKDVLFIYNDQIINTVTLR